MTLSRITRRGFVASGAALALATVAGQRPARANDPLKIWKFGSPQDERAYFTSVNERYGGGPLAVEFFDWDARQQKMAAGAAAGDLPSIAIIENSMVPELASRGVLANLNESMSDAVAAWSEIFEPKLFDLGRYNDGFYGFSPYVDLSPVLLCNTDMFSAAGLTPPRTWSELVATAEKLNEGGRAGIVFAASGASLDAEIVGSISIKNGCRWTNAEGKFALSETGFRDTLKLVADLVSFAPPGLTDLNFRGALQVFFQDRAAMVITKSFAPIIQAGMQVRADYPYTMVPFPMPDQVTGDNEAAAFEAQAAFQFSPTRDADIAATRAYLDYWADPEQQMGWNGSVIKGRIPTAKKVLASGGFAENYPGLAKQYADGSLFEGVISIPAFPEYGALRSEVTLALQGVVVGQYTPEKATAGLLAAGQKAMSK